MLLGKQFGGRGECDLLALLHREHRRQCGDHGLAATDIALHQPQHRRGLRKVASDLLEHPLLRAGELKRQGAAQLLHQRAVAGQAGRVETLQRDALAAQAELMRQQLFNGQALLGRMASGEQLLRISADWRAMHGQQCRA